MAKIWYGHFDSTQEDPRMLLAEDWARFIRAFLSDGVKNGGYNLQVTAADTGMKVKLDSGPNEGDSGVAHIQGYVFNNIYDMTGRYYEVDGYEAHPVLDRIDRLVIRLDRTIQVRAIEPVMLLGTAAANPVPPALTRNSNCWELSLAQIRIPAGAIGIRNEYITDERLDSSVCGLIDSLIAADTEGMYYDFKAKFTEEMLSMANKFNSDLAGMVSKYENFYDSSKNEIENWYNTVKMDISKLQTFDFDNLAEMPGVSLSTNFNPDGSIAESLNMTISGKKCAERLTLFNEDGSIETTVTVYAEDGESVLRRSAVNTSFNADGSIKQEITGNWTYEPGEDSGGIAPAGIIDGGRF